MVVNSLKVRMPNLHQKLDDQCLLTDLQSSKICRYELALKCLPPL
jgi:hypothetical protein